jgi:hypothetical protein
MEPMGTLILDLQPPGLQVGKFCCSHVASSAVQKDLDTQRAGHKSSYFCGRLPLSLCSLSGGGPRQSSAEHQGQSHSLWFCSWGSAAYDCAVPVKVTGQQESHSLALPHLHRAQLGISLDLSFTWPHSPCPLSLYPAGHLLPLPDPWQEGSSLPPGLASIPTRTPCSPVADEGKLGVSSLSAGPQRRRNFQLHLGRGGSLTHPTRACLGAPGGSFFGCQLSLSRGSQITSSILHGQQLCETELSLSPHSG